MNPILSKTFTYLILANGFAFSGWVIRNYLINWWVLEKTNSTTIVGLVAATPALTVLLTAPIGGQLADKYSRKNLFLAARILSVFLFLSVALVVHFDFYALPIVVICFLGIGIQAGIEVPAAKNLILDVATFKFLTLGNSLMEFVNQILSTAGPPLIAIFFTSIDDTFIFFSMPAVHALSVLFAFLFFIRFKEKKNIEEEDKKNKKTLLDGIHYSYKFVNIRILLILTSTILFWGLTHPLIPRISKDVLNAGPEGYAILLSAGALGAIIGSITLPLAQSFFRNSKSIVLCITCYSITLIGLALSKSIILSSIFLGLGGFFHLIWFTVIIILLQTLPDENHRGRVIGLFFTFVQLIGLGFIIGGALGDTIGINTTIYIASSSLIAIHIICFFSSSSFRSLKS
tara:strand:- start:229 stop:1431 length:1203 start_codon:yes stop_codon:yes gene_type:complete